MLDSLTETEYLSFMEKNLIPNNIIEIQTKQRNKLMTIIIIIILITFCLLFIYYMINKYKYL